MSFTLAQLLSAVRREDSVISAETSGYVALALAEQALDGRSWDENSVCLEAAGTLTVHHNNEPATRVSQRAVLRWLLSRASGENLALAACCRASLDEDAAWVGALRSALVPLNRSAAKRALMRLHRRLEALGEERLLAHVTAERAALLRELAQTSPAEEPLSVVSRELHEDIAAPEKTSARVDAVAQANTTAQSVESLQDSFVALEKQEYTPRVLPVAVRPRWESDATPQLRSWAVELRDPLADPPLPRRATESDETRALWPKAVPETELEPNSLSVAAASEPIGVEPPPDELTVPEPVSVYEREPGLGQVQGRKSDVSQLLTSFGVGAVLTERELLLALRRSVESQGTPLPPRVGNARRGSRR